MSHDNVKFYEIIFPFQNSISTCTISSSDAWFPIMYVGSSSLSNTTSLKHSTPYSLLPCSSYDDKAPISHPILDLFIVFESTHEISFASALISSIPSTNQLIH